MAGALNLRLKGNLYHFRRKIPLGPRQRIGKAEWVRSLGTGNARLAAARARELWLASEEILRQVKDDPTITRAEFERLVKEAIEDFQWADEVRLAKQRGHLDGMDADRARLTPISLECGAREYRGALLRNDIAPVRHLIDEYTRRLERQVAAGSVDKRLVGRARAAAYEGAHPQSCSRQARDQTRAPLLRPWALLLVRFGARQRIMGDSSDATAQSIQPCS